MSAHTAADASSGERNEPGASRPAMPASPVERRHRSSQRRYPLTARRTAGDHSHLADRLTTGRGEHVEREPGAEAAHIVARPVETQAVITHCLIDRNVTEPDLSKDAQACLDEKVNLEAGIAVAEINHPGLEDQPVAAAADRNAGKPKFDNVPTLAWRRLSSDIAADIPHQEVGIEIAGIDQIVTQPALRPKTHLLDHRK